MAPLFDQEIYGILEHFLGQDLTEDFSFFDSQICRKGTFLDALQDPIVFQPDMVLVRKNMCSASRR